MVMILTTRPGDKNALLSSALIAEGFQVKSLPLLDIQPLSPNATWFDIQKNIADFDFIIVVSPRAARIGADFLLDSLKNWPKHIQVWTTGNATSKILQSYGISPHTPAFASNATEIADYLEPICKNKKILLWKGVGGRTILRERLAAQCAEWIEWEMYQRVSATYSADELTKTFDSKIDAAIITSGEALQNYLKIIARVPADTYKKIVIVPSQRIAFLAEQAGFKTFITEGASNAAFVKGVKDWVKAQ